MTNPTDRVEIITSVQRRRRWTASEKVRMVEETFEPGMTVSVSAWYGREPVSSSPLTEVPDRVQSIGTTTPQPCAPLHKLETS